MINLVISGLLYIEALKWGMPAKRWWCAGVVFGVASCNQSYCLALV